MKNIKSFFFFVFFFLSENIQFLEMKFFIHLNRRFFRNGRCYDTVYIRVVKLNFRARWANSVEDKHSRFSLSRLCLSRITAHLEVKFW